MSSLLSVILVTFILIWFEIYSIVLLGIKKSIAGLPLETTCYNKDLYSKLSMAKLETKAQIGSAFN